MLLGRFRIRHGLGPGTVKAGGWRSRFIAHDQAVSPSRAAETFTYHQGHDLAVMLNFVEAIGAMLVLIL